LDPGQYALSVHKSAAQRTTHAGMPVNAVILQPDAPAETEPLSGDDLFKDVKRPSKRATTPAVMFG
jgi:hypothetical protein